MALNRKQLEEVARKLVAAAPQWAEIEDDVGLCAYASKQFGVELTLREAGKVRVVMDDIQQDREKPSYAASIPAITVIDCADVMNFSVMSVRTYHADAEGEAAAKEFFRDRILSTFRTDPPPDDEIEQAWDSGKFSTISGFIAVVRSAA